jgi:MHS family proline/betaine transporter-like MFS transporter
MLVYFGTFLEFFEFVLFATLFPVLAKLLNADFTPDQQATLQYLLFWVGFLARPLGALILSPIGDLYNRRSVLIISVIGMAVTTMVMGCIPITVNPLITIAFIVVLRLFQGFFTGVEYASATIYSFESTSDKEEKKRSVIYMGMMATLGTAMAYFVSAFCQLELMSLLNFWRAIFLLTGFLGLWIGGLRLTRLPKDFMNIKPTAFKEKQNNTSPFKNGILAFFIVGMSYGPFYYITSFLNVYGVVLQQSDPFYSFLLNGFICLMVILVMYAITFRFKKVFFNEQYITKYYFMFFLSVLPLSYIIFHTESIGLIVLSQFLLIVSSQLIVTNVIGIVPFLFNAYVRVRSYTFVQTLAASILGGAAPLLCHLLVVTFGDKSFASLYPMALTAVSYFCFKKVKIAF